LNSSGLNNAGPHWIDSIRHTTPPVNRNPNALIKQWQRISVEGEEGCLHRHRCSYLSGNPKRRWARSLLSNPEQKLMLGLLFAHAWKWRRLTKEVATAISNSRKGKKIAAAGTRWSPFSPVSVARRDAHFKLSDRIAEFFSAAMEVLCSSGF